jgi:hypothetical protein
MADLPFISRELDRRIASAQAAVDTGKIDPETANANLKPWAAAEAWLAGHPFPGTSPRNCETRASEICPIEDAIAALTRARDTLARVIEREKRTDLIDHWRDMADAVRRLERQRDGTAAFRAMAQQAPVAPSPKTALPPIAPSLLADMFDGDGNPLPLHSQQAA